MNKVIDNIFYRFYKMFKNGNIHHSSVIGSLIFTTLILYANISFLIHLIFSLIKIKYNIPYNVELIIIVIPIGLFLYMTYYKDKKYEKIIEYYDKETKKEEMKRILYFGLICLFSIILTPLITLLLRHFL